MTRGRAAAERGSVWGASCPGGLCAPEASEVKMSARRLGKCQGERPGAFPALAFPPAPAEDAPDSAASSRGLGKAPPKGAAAGSSWEQPPVPDLAPKFLPLGLAAGDSWVLGEVSASLQGVGPQARRVLAAAPPRSS